MTIAEIITMLQELDGTLVWRPGPGDGSPEIAWGDVFCYYAPDQVVPATGQPFATIVVKDYPGDDRSRLDRPDTFRVNVAAGRQEFIDRLGRQPRDAEPPGTDPSRSDTVMAHPVYGELGWLAVVNPGRRTEADVRALIRKAHSSARNRWQRRTVPRH
ncbi:DUF6194 family protein [Microlunatus soli]|uniref:DUF6194 domain-containing protein n=1 Tax=Microlunatus soli TaxID=630515 RepID=A0A1H1Z7Q9_9ACTN|nr:DUF6194 family protein [Microlunatus soli]SDT29246.1 hypothetical protein SAMN04489812_5011 [Microlunatus soli]